MKLSGTQLVWTFATIEIVIIIWLRITPAIKQVQQDAWLSMLVGLVLSAAFLMIVVQLSKFHPNQTMVQYCQTLLGKWGGRIIVLPYLLQWLLLPAGALRSFGDFIHLILLDRTPVWLIMALVVGLMIYITFAGGITAIGRFCVVMGPVTIITLIISFVLNAPNLQWTNIQPVYADSGMVSIIKGSVAPASFFAESLVLLGLLPFMTQPKKALSRTLLAVSMTAITTAIATLMVILVFGQQVAAQLRFPYFMLVRSINILNFIQNVDIFVIYVWIFGFFARLSFFLFISSYEIANWLKLKNWRNLIWFGAPMMFIEALLIPNETYLQSIDKLWVTVIFPVFGLAIPLFLLLLSIGKKRYAG